MKIGIVTWHKGNIGGTLQAFALSETIKKLGYDPELINLKSNKYEPAVRFIRNCLFHIVYFKSGITRDYTYVFICNKEKESPNLLYDELKEYAKQYNACICGSDQIWNCSDGVNPYYFLQFVSESKRISYAPSIGRKNIKKEFQPEFVKCISSIPYLSVREKRGADIIHQLSGMKAKVVLDPTLLLTKEEWLSLAKDVKIEKFGIEKGEYILCYYLGRQNQYDKYTQKLSEKLEKKIIYISFKRRNFGKNQVVCSIEEFIALIRDSYCMLTDSYHGTVLPLNLQKRVATFERFSEDDPENQNSRIDNIVTTFGLQSWIIHPEDDIDKLISRVDNLDDIQLILEKERETSISYLKNSLASACNMNV